MSLLDELSRPEVWRDFCDYKASLVCPKWLLSALREFIREEKYLPVVRAIREGRPFPLPKKAVISKLSSGKKRTVYCYPNPENTVLKCLTWLMLRKYDGLFEDSLYSFRPGRTAKDAVRKLLRTAEPASLYLYKADIHDYFNSVPVRRFLPLLKSALSDDPALYHFLSSLLLEPRVLDSGREIRENKGIMAGTPQSSFYANLYLSGLDRLLSEKGLLACRYSDDIIVCSKTEAEMLEASEDIRAYLQQAGLTLNPEKEVFSGPGEPFTFLGFQIDGKRVDIAPVTVKKLKAKMRRKRDALARWQRRNEEDPERAARAFIRIFNRKLLESPENHELSWAAWFFSVINTPESLHEIDLYAQDCLRFLLTGTHTKKRFRITYADLKALGYRSVVHAYYEFHRQREP